MPCETIHIDGSPVETLQELLRPRLRAVFVGINPSPVSVSAGCYFQGKLGKAFWRRLQRYRLTSALPAGREDAAAFEQGFGFADVIRRPTARATMLTKEERQIGARSLALRLQSLPDRPLIIFVFKDAEDCAAAALQAVGFRTTRMPAPYATREQVDRAMTDILRQLG